MERKDFTKQLLNIAFAAMVCDGHIDQDEEDYLKEIEKRDFYLKEFDLSKNLSELKDDWELNGLRMCERILKSTYHMDLTDTQKLVMLEFAIGIVRSDGKMEQPEIEFVNKLIVNLLVPSALVEQTFGNWSVIDDLTNKIDLEG